MHSDKFVFESNKTTEDEKKFEHNKKIESNETKNAKKSLQIRTNEIRFSIPKKLENQKNIPILENLTSLQIYDNSDDYGRYIESDNEKDSNISENHNYNEQVYLDTQLGIRENKNSFVTGKSLNEKLNKLNPKMTKNSWKETDPRLSRTSNKSANINNDTLYNVQKSALSTKRVNDPVYSFKNRQIPSSADSIISDFDNVNSVIDFKTDKIELTDLINNDERMNESQTEDGISNNNLFSEISISNKSESSTEDFDDDDNVSINKDVNHLHNEIKGISQNFISKKNLPNLSYRSGLNQNYREHVDKNKIVPTKLFSDKKELNEKKQQKLPRLPQPIKTAEIVPKQMDSIRGDKNNSSNKKIETKNKNTSSCSNFGKNLFGRSSNKNHQNHYVNNSKKDYENHIGSNFELDKLESSYFCNDLENDKCSHEGSSNYEILSEDKVRNKSSIYGLLKFRIKNILLGV